MTEEERFERELGQFAEAGECPRCGEAGAACLARTRGAVLRSLLLQPGAALCRASWPAAWGEIVGLTKCGRLADTACFPLSEPPPGWLYPPACSGVGRAAAAPGGV